LNPGGAQLILVVDDDSAIRVLVARILRRAGYETAMAANGEEALTELRARRFEAVVLDLMMPVMSGFEVLRYLDEHDDAGAPPVIVVSATSEADLKSIDSPAVHAVLRKPFDVQKLIETVHECAPLRVTAERPPR
jgi:CheY-like chemotaxis protein